MADESPSSSQHLATPPRAKRARSADQRELEFRGGINKPVRVEPERERVCCNVHGSVFLEPLLKELVDTAHLQRLNRLKQCVDGSRTHTSVVRSRGLLPVFAHLLFPVV